MNFDYSVGIHLLVLINLKDLVNVMRKLFASCVYNRLHAGGEGRAGYPRGGWDDNGWGIGVPDQPERRHLG